MRALSPVVRFGTIAVFLATGACSSIERAADRQRRYRRYSNILRSLPKQTTRAALYAALHPKSPPPVPGLITGSGGFVFGDECYPLDDDFQLSFWVFYTRGQTFWDIGTGTLHPGLQSPKDRIFSRPAIERIPKATNSSEGNAFR